MTQVPNESVLPRSHNDSVTELIEYPYVKPADPMLYLLSEEPRILIVEDDPEVGELIGAILRPNWCKCVIRRSGVQGILAFTSQPVDLVITDLRMELGDGLDVIEAFRRTSQAPVIIVTGYAKEYANSVRFLDNVAVLNKPIEGPQLVALVERALEGGGFDKPRRA
jgi:DNA-binding response OmpR family regulator